VFYYLALIGWCVCCAYCVLRGGDVAVVTIILVGLLMIGCCLIGLAIGAWFCDLCVGDGCWLVVMYFYCVL